MQMLTLDDVAARLGVCRRTAETLLAGGRLPKPARFGRVRRWSDAQIDAFIQAEIERADGRPGVRRGRPRND